MTYLEVFNWLKCFDYEMQDIEDAQMLLADLKHFKPENARQAFFAAELREYCLWTIADVTGDDFLLLSK